MYPFVDQTKKSPTLK